MQQRFRKLALFLGAASVTTGGLIIVACSSDSGTTPVPTTPVVEAGNKDTGTGADTGTPTDTDSGDAGVADCAAAPTLRTNTAAGGFHCGHYRADAAVDGAASLSNCVTGQTCCNPGIADGGTFNGKFPPSFCADGTGGDTACADQDTAHGSDYQPGFFSNSWQCNDKTSCAPGEICVMFTSPYVTKPTDIANVGKDTKAPAACDIHKAFKQGGSRCKTGAPAANEVLLCSESDQGCGAGTTCKPFNGNGSDLGSCR